VVHCSDTVFKYLFHYSRNPKYLIREIYSKILGAVSYIQHNVINVSGNIFPHHFFLLQFHFYKT